MNIKKKQDKEFLNEGEENDKEFEEYLDDEFEEENLSKKD